MGGGTTLVVRQRLLDRATAATVTLISGPSGFGKTSLAVQLMAGSQHGAVRVLIDQDVTAAGLAAQIGQVLSTAGLSDLANALAAADPAEARDAFVGAWGARTDPLLVVLDEVQHSDAGAHAWIQQLVDSVPDGHRLVLVGRRTPFAPNHPSDRFAVVGVDDLRFTRDEIEVALTNGGVHRRWVDEIADRTAGWPAAVTLARDRLVTHPDSSPFTTTDDGESLLRHLVSQLLDHRTGLERDRLHRLAAVPRLSPLIADTIAGAGAMDLLLDSGLPLTTTTPGWIELPDVVRTMLDAAAPMPVDAAREVARMYLDRSQFAAALGVMRSAGDLDGLADLFEERPWLELEAYGLPQVRAGLMLIGDQRLAARPQLLVKAAWVAEGRDPSARRGWLALADAATAPESRWRAMVDAELARDAGRRGDVDAAERIARVALQRAGSDDLVPRAKALLAWGMANTIRCTESSLAEADEQLTESAMLFRLVGETRWETDALNRLGYAVSFHGGRCVEAEQQMRSALSMLPSASRERAIMLTYFIDVLDHLGRTEEAMAAGREAMNIGRRLGDQLVLGYTTWALAWVAVHANDEAGTRRLLAETERHGGRWIEEANGVEFALAACEAMCMIGDEAGARRYQQQAVERAERHSLSDALPPGLARMEATFGDPEVAESILADLDDAPFAVVRSRWLRRLLRAYAAHRRGDTAMAQRMVDETFSEAAAIDQPDLPMRHEQRLVAALAQYRPHAVDPVVLPRRLILLGGFTLFGPNGDDVSPPPGHPATLVKLLALRSTSTVEEVIDSLWPDADVSTGRSRLRNLLNRIKSVSGDVVIRTADSLRLDPSIDIDVTTFESLAAGAFAADAGERPGLARLAAAVYTGELLPGDRFEDWAAARRERLKRLFLALVDLLATDAEQRGEFDEALRQLDLGIASEPLDETRYVRAATMLIQQGRRVTAAEVVRRAVAVLDDLGVAPSTALGELIATVGRSLDGN